MPFELLVLPKPRLPRKVLGYLVVFLILSLVGTSGYFFYQYQKLASSPVAGAVRAEEESARLIKTVGKMILLPSDESPSIATVTDIDKLSSQAFFKNAKNGDKVLIFEKTKQVIIFDPTANLIINVGSINKPEEQT